MIDWLDAEMSSVALLIPANRSPLQLSKDPGWENSTAKYNIDRWTAIASLE